MAKYAAGGELTEKQKKDPRIQALIGKPSVSYTFWISYNAPDGTPYEFAADSKSRKDALAIGQAVQVSLDPNTNGNPNHARFIDDDYHSRPRWIIAAGIAILLFTIFMFVLTRAGGEIVMPWAKD